MMLNRRAIALFLILSLLSLPALAQVPSDPDLLSRIRKEETDNSQIMKTMHMLTDVYGPRLTGSPNHKNAAEWAVKQMQLWGLENAHLEPWDLGHPGWLNERLTAHIVSPVKDSLVCEVLAWTPSTNGTVRARAFQMILPEHTAPASDRQDVANTTPTAEELAVYLESIKDKVKGKIVLVGKNRFVPVNINPPAKRRDPAQWKAQFDPNNPNAGQGPPRRGDPQQQNQEQGPSRLSGQQIDARID